MCLVIASGKCQLHKISFIEACEINLANFRFAGMSKDEAAKKYIELGEKAIAKYGVK